MSVGTSSVSREEIRQLACAYRDAILCDTASHLTASAHNHAAAKIQIRRDSTTTAGAHCDTLLQSQYPFSIHSFPWQSAETNSISLCSPHVLLDQLRSPSDINPVHIHLLASRVLRTVSSQNPSQGWIVVRAVDSVADLPAIQSL